MISELPDDRLRSYIVNGITPSLSIAVGSKDEELFTFQEGTMSFVQEAPVQRETLFNVGSTTKMFTAALIVKLVEEGEVTLNDLVRRFIPEFPVPQITIGHLLTHTSGLREVKLGWPGLGGIKAYFEALYGRTGWNALPETQFAYYTAGYSILMDVIERITGGTIEAYARASLFDPLGMTRTTYDTASLVNGEFTVPCHKDRPGDESGEFRLATTGDSGLHSTAAELIRFGRLLLNRGIWEGRRIFTEASVDLMFRERTGGRHAFSAIGMMKAANNPHGCFSDLNSPETIGHPGYSGCMLWIDPVYGLTGAVVTNSENLHEDWRNYRTLLALSMKRALH
ncbi:serine hydrolase domain-containing protein [Paenibacillus sacheonensis]|uniref:Serine hydrolase n=1 Tax=Paenibacillus sacheonensis TaxID=742054 RepID=A0A7X5BYX3_9BACL|nr:serine hydrolase domain-containing protein [Paenibacillus sacheonensis]MBM7568363.1 CubicO group peptidase (beta-lactamase class C family) [Paenibacillus sacheonensis]NBC72063.1 serine hydrolase [Paenibacillus sacheonensis]